VALEERYEEGWEMLIFGLRDPFGLGNISIAFGIDRQSVAVGKFFDLVPRTPEARENFSAGMVENLDLLVAPVGHVHVFLLQVRRKADPPRGAPIVGKAVSSLDPDGIFEISILSKTCGACCAISDS
jgi:hypothetical protein